MANPAIRRFFVKIRNKITATSEDERVALNMLLSGMSKLVSLIVSFISAPIVLNYLGVEKYGVWSLLLSILSWISYFDIGIGNGLRNRLTEAYARKEKERCSKLVSSAYAIITILMIVVSLAVLFLAQRLNWHEIFGVSQFDEDLTQIVCVSFAFIAVTFILSICKTVLYALQQAANVGIMELCIQVLNLIGVIVVSTVTTNKLFLIACIYGGSMVLVNGLGGLIIYNKHRYMCPRIKHVDIKAGIDLTKLGLKFLLIQMCALVLFTTDNLIISQLYGASNVTSYTTVNKLYNVLVQASTAVLAPVWSSVTKAKAKNNYTWLKRGIRKLNILMIPFFAAALLLACIFRPLSDVWLGQKLDYHHGLIFWGMVYCILMIWCNAYSYVSNGLEIMKESTVIAVIQAVVNIPASLFFAEVVGMKDAGVLLGTVFAMSISAVLSPIFVYTRIRKGIQ